MISIPDLVILAGYFVAMIFVGVFFARRMSNIGQFFGGGRQVPWWLSAVSFYMTTFSAFALIIYSEIAYRHGMVSMTLFWMSAPASLLAGYFFAARWRRAARTSALEFIEDRYGTLMRQWLAWLNIPLRVIDSGLKLFAIGTLIAGALGLGPEWIKWAILFSGLAVFVYTFLGGLWGVLVTDFVQAIVMLFAVMILLPLAIINSGGMGAILEAMPPEFYHLTTEQYHVLHLLAWLVILFLNYTTGWALVQRFYSVDSDKSARKVAYSVAVLQFLSPPILFAPAIAARVFLPDLEGEEVTMVYALIVRELLPVGLIGLMIAAMFAATMSMLSSEYNAVASVMTNDVYKGYFRKNAGERTLLLAGRISTVIVGILSLLIAFLILLRPDDKSLFDVMMGVFALFLPPMAVPMLAGLCSRRVTNGGGIVSLVFGITAGLVVYILSRNIEYFEFLSANVWVVPITVGSSIAGLILGTLALPMDSAARQRVDTFFAMMDRPPDITDKTIKASTSTPLTISGICLLFLGGISLLAVLPVITGELVWLSAVVSLMMIVLGGVMWWFNREGLRGESGTVTSNEEDSQ